MKKINLLRLIGCRGLNTVISDRLFPIWYFLQLQYNILNKSHPAMWSGVFSFSSQNEAKKNVCAVLLALLVLSYEWGFNDFANAR